MNKIKILTAKPLAAAGALVFMILLGASTAAAQNAPQPYILTFDFLAGEFCEFPTRLTLEGKEKILFLPGNRVTVTSPGVVFTLTNLDDPSKTLTEVITGAIQLTFKDNGDTQVKLTGRNLYGFDPNDPPVLTIGNFSFTYDENFNVIQPLTGKGKRINVCEALN